VSGARPRRVVVLRGLAANPWDLRPWEELGDGYEVSVLVPGNNQYDVAALRSVRAIPVQTVGGRLPGGAPGRFATRAIGERYLGLEPLLRGADIVHAAELGYWFSWQAARLKAALGFRLALTVWETLPFVDAYRNVRTRRYRRDVLAAADRFLATTERARDALLLEGAVADRIALAPPGIDAERFGAARTPAPRADGRHLLLSIGRLVWEKGHQDLLRAVALLRSRGRDDVRVLIVGVGPEEGRLRGVVRDLGLDDVVELRGWVPYDELPRVYAQASCLVLASLAVPFWEEQFGMVLAEAMAAHVPIFAAASGAIPEVVGDSGTLFGPGDWQGLATALAAGPLSAAPGTRRAPEPDRLTRYSSAAAAARLRAVYDELLPA
jgi:glycosyltransferase involved in cell wall biosynthesis